MKTPRFAAATGLVLALAGCGAPETYTFTEPESSFPRYVKEACWDFPDETIQIAVDEVREAKSQGYSKSEIKNWEIDSCLAVADTRKSKLVDFCNNCLGRIVDYSWK